MPSLALRQADSQWGDTGQVIRAARPDDISVIRDIEVAGGELFRGLGMDAVAADTPPTESELAPYVRDGRAWVATEPHDIPIAYILVEIVDGLAHIEQVTVHPLHSRMGLGRALIEQVERWSIGCGLNGMTLTTFRDVPWNAPYYERLGFMRVPEPAWSEGLRQIRRQEGAHGLNAWPRVVMKKPSKRQPGSRGRIAGPGPDGYRSEGR